MAATNQQTLLAARQAVEAKVKADAEMNVVTGPNVSLSENAASTAGGTAASKARRRRATFGQDYDSGVKL